MSLRESPFENLRVPLGWSAGGALVVAIAVAIFLLLSDRSEADQRGHAPIRNGFEAAAAPVGGVFAAPVRWLGQASDYIDDYFFAVSENRRLREELADLRAERDAVVALRNLNSQYQALLGLRVEPDVPLVSARSVSEARGPFRRARLIDVGHDRGVEVGNPVINEHGLVGRITGVSGSVSRVLLVTDVTSQIPILVGRTDARAIMRGDGSGNPRLEFVRGSDTIEVGDRILSSGDGGLLPRGLPIGVAARGIDGTWRVKLFSDRGAIDFVRVMRFDSFSQLADPSALDAPPLAGLETALPPTPEVAARIDDAQGRRRADAERRAQAAREAREREAADARARQVASEREAAAEPPATEATE